MLLSTAEWKSCIASNVIWSLGSCVLSVAGVWDKCDLVLFVCEWISRCGLGAIQPEDPSSVSIKVSGSLHLLLSPRFPVLCCRQRTGRENINISKTSTDNSLLICSRFRSCNLSCEPFLSLTLHPPLFQGKTSLSWSEGWLQWSRCKSHWLSVLDPMDG